MSETLKGCVNIFVPFLGRGGETLKFITRTTGAKVNCPRERGRSLEEKGKVSIAGTRLEVRQAKVRAGGHAHILKASWEVYFHASLQLSPLKLSRVDVFYRK